MSAAAARRRKQQQKRAAAKSGGDESDPVQIRLDALLQDPTLTEESVAYEALQLAQSAVRRNVKLGDFAKATEVAYSTSLTLLVKSGRVSVSSQLLAVLVQVLGETHTECTDEWVDKFAKLDAAYRTALDNDDKMNSDERGRLQRLHLQFLKKGLKWSNDLGKIRFGATGMHALLGDHCWNMSCDEAVVGTEAERAEAAAKIEEDSDEELEDEDWEIGLRSEAVSHYALAEQIGTILEKLKSLPGPTAEEGTMGHVCPPAQRDELLTRSILVLLAVENLRDARTLASSYLTEVETTRTAAQLKKSYLDKTDGKAPSHVMFVCMLIRICEKDAKTAPLFNWLVRNFGAELGTMHEPEVIKTYTTKIGRVYFDIQPPPNMMDMMENMMGMMGGMGGGMGGAAGGMNPMMAAMQAMQQGGGM
eukprot:CAMPEP_0183704742 /NCGR_PEP_ID=MMETSP0737-20130205/2029_1 /TAXON_ID=385413 /ORGANISM="Thalassiosira miniscula, Strain CCMP1093" /LENGTH=418 /DNA_ID=CAMNT_0025931733 /DNA_START=54 /DNA_END=1310 /DNA_ORIENTATION=-